MPGPDLASFSAVTFDVYGTLIDWEPEIARFLGVWVESQGLVRTHAELLATHVRYRDVLAVDRGLSGGGR